MRSSIANKTRLFETDGVEKKISNDQAPVVHAIAKSLHTKPKIIKRHDIIKNSGE